MKSKQRTSQSSGKWTKQCGHLLYSRQKENKVRWHLCSRAATKFTSALSPSALNSVPVNAGTTALCWIEMELHSGILFFLLADLNRSERIELNSSPSHLPTTGSKPKFLRATFFPRRAIGSIDDYCDSKTSAPDSETRGYKRH